MLTCLKADVLNCLGNCNRLNVKGPDERAAKEKAVQYYKEACLEDGPNFHSHNIGLSLADLYVIRSSSKHDNESTRAEAVASGSVILHEAWKHLLNAIVYRSQAASSKSFQSILRLCDTHRTLSRVWRLSEEAGNVLASVVQDGQLIRLHKERLIVLRRLRTCAKSLEDRTDALKRLNGWVEVTNCCFWKNISYCSVMLMRTEQQRLPSDQSSVAVSGAATLIDREMFEFATEAVRTRTGLRIDSGVPVNFLLGFCAACHSLLELAERTIAVDANSVTVAHFISCSQVLYRIGRASGKQALHGHDRKWHEACCKSIEGLIALWDPLLQETFSLSPLDDNAAIALKSNELPYDSFVPDPELYLARLLWVNEDDMSRTKRVNLLLACIAAKLAILHTEDKVAASRPSVISVNSKKGASAAQRKNQGGGNQNVENASNSTKNRHNADSYQSSVRKLVLLWYSSTCEKVPLSAGMLSSLLK
jgi:hypothetical protein